MLSCLICSSVTSHRLGRDASATCSTRKSNAELYSTTTPASRPPTLVLRLLSRRRCCCTETAETKGREGSVLFEELEFAYHSIPITSGRRQAREALLEEDDRRALPLAGEPMSMSEQQQQLIDSTRRLSKRTARSLCYTMARHTPTGISIRVSSLQLSYSLPCSPEYLGRTRSQQDYQGHHQPLKTNPRQPSPVR